MGSTLPGHWICSWRHSKGRLLVAEHLGALTYPCTQFMHTNTPLLLLPLHEGPCSSCCWPDHHRAWHMFLQRSTQDVPARMVNRPHTMSGNLHPTVYLCPSHFAGASELVIGEEHHHAWHILGQLHAARLQAASWWNEGGTRLARRGQAAVGGVTQVCPEGGGGGGGVQLHATRLEAARWWTETRR